MALCDDARIDARTDVYLLGATLHAAVSGQPRHVGDNLFAVLFSSMQSAPFDYPAAVPAELAGLCAHDGALGSEAFAPAVRDFYFTNAVARASAVMGELSALRTKAGSAAKAKATHG